MRGGGLCVCALDTELLGHWWHEGIAGWAPCSRRPTRGPGAAPLDDALAEVDAGGRRPAPAAGDDAGATPRDLRDLERARGRRPRAGARASAELRVVAAGAAAGDRALRELLALQASDWAFLVTSGTAGAYPRERADGHRAAFDAALAGDEGDGRVRSSRRTWRVRPCWRREDVPSSTTAKVGPQTTHIAEFPPPAGGGRGTQGAASAAQGRIAGTAGVAQSRSREPVS